MLPLRFQAEEVIEGGNSIDPAEGYFQGASDVDQEVLFKIPENTLGNVQDFNQRIAAGLVLFYGPVNQLKPIVATGMSHLFQFLCLCAHKYDTS